MMTLPLMWVQLLLPQPQQYDDDYYDNVSEDDGFSAAVAAAGDDYDDDIDYNGSHNDVDINNDDNTKL